MLPPVGQSSHSYPEKFTVIFHLLYDRFVLLFSIHLRYETIQSIVSLIRRPPSVPVTNPPPLSHRLSFLLLIPPYLHAVAIVLYRVFLFCSLLFLSSSLSQKSWCYFFCHFSFGWTTIKKKKDLIANSSLTAWQLFRTPAVSLSA